MGSANNRAEAESDSENDDAEASSKPKPVYATVQTKAHQQRVRYFVPCLKPNFDPLVTMFHVALLYF